MSYKSLEICCELDKFVLMYLKYLLLITTTMFYCPRTPGVSGEGGRDVGREGDVHCGDPEQTRVCAEDAQSV